MFCDRPCARAKRGKRRKKNYLLKYQVVLISKSYHISVSFREDKNERYRCIPTILINELKRNNENRVLFFPIETFRTLSFWLRRLMTSFKTQIIDSQKLQKTIEIDRGNAYLSRRKMFTNNEQRERSSLVN